MPRKDLRFLNKEREKKNNQGSSIGWRLYIERMLGHPARYYYIRVITIILPPFKHVIYIVI